MQNLSLIPSFEIPNLNPKPSIPEPKSELKRVVNYTQNPSLITKPRNPKPKSKPRIPEPKFELAGPSIIAQQKSRIIRSKYTQIQA
jgi:hypothetical protein